MMHSYAHSPLARSSADLHEGVTHGGVLGLYSSAILTSIEYEPDVDADGFRRRVSWNKQMRFPRY